MSKEKIVIDTSLFTNPDVYRAMLSSNPYEAVESFLDILQKTSVDAYIPRSVYIELSKIVDIEKIRGKFETLVKIKSPKRQKISITGDILFCLIEDIRNRINKGLKIAEDYVKEAFKENPSNYESSKQNPEGPIILRLREKYREVLRQGIIDSREDVDIILLAIELEAPILSGDEGILKWADKLGVRVIDGRFLKDFLEGYICY